MNLQTFRWRLEKAAFCAVTYPLARLPYRVSLRTGDLIGDLMRLALRRRRQIALQNVAESLPWLEKQPGWRMDNGTAADIVRRMFRNFGRSLVENFRLYYGRGASILDAVEYRGMEHYHAAKERGKGVAFITGHCGNWELVALACGAHYGGLAVVARRQDNPLLNELVEKMRLQYDNVIIYKEGALRQIFGRLRKNGNIGILADQAVMPDEGVLVDFLGRPAWTTKMPSLIARKSGVALLPAFTHREGDRLIITVNPPVELDPSDDTEGVVEDVRQLNRSIEDYIVRHPDEWYWVHRRWKRAPAAQG